MELTHLILSFVWVDGLIVSHVQGQSCASSCQPPDCSCPMFKYPMDTREIPQMVYFGFDDAVNVVMASLYERLFTPERVNPNGCRMKMTLFVSNQYTDYRRVKQFYDQGMEIGVHSVTHSAVDSDEKLRKEAKEEKESIMHAGIPEEEIVGWRSPFLKSTGNNQPYILKELGYEYDISLTYTITHLSNPKPWPFTMQNGWPYTCGVPPCPRNARVSQFWEVPVITLMDYQQQYPCAFVDGCTISATTEDDAFKYLWNNFMSYYNTTRTPFGLNMHAAWFITQYNLKAMMRFMDELQKMDDVYVVTVKQVIDWMKQPTHLSNIHTLESWSCPEVNTGKLQATCPTFSSQGHCFPPSGSPSCVKGNIQNGSDLNWYSANTYCAKDDGRLVWIQGNFSKDALISTLQHTSAYSNYNFLRIGLMGSVKGDSRLFWKDASNESVLLCGNKETEVCSHTARTAESCSALGCCMKHGTCQYPDEQTITPSNASVSVDTTSISSNNTRYCVGLARQTHNSGVWTWKAYNCSELGNATTGYVCEYKCGSTWPSAYSIKVSAGHEFVTTGRGVVTSGYGVVTTEHGVVATEYDGMKDGSVVTVGLTGKLQATCPTFSSQGHCLPPSGSPSCVKGNIQNGSDLNWYSTNKNCAKDDGRLVWIQGTFSKDALIGTFQHTPAYSNYNFLRIGLMGSVKGDSSLFWKDASNASVLLCGNKETEVCSHTARTAESCSALGCCMKHGTCQYPDEQTIAPYNASVSVDTTSISSNTTRYCVGLARQTHNPSVWTWTAYNCSELGNATTGYVCEYNCGSTWPSVYSVNVSAGHDFVTSGRSIVTSGHGVVTTEHGVVATEYESMKDGSVGTVGLTVGVTVGIAVCSVALVSVWLRLSL